MGVRRERRRLVVGLLLAATVSAATVAPVAADTNLIVGDEAVVAHTNGDGVNMRDAVSGNVLSTLPDGTTLSVLAGPQSASDGSQWYNVAVNSQEGWIVSDYLSREAAQSGQSVTVTGTNGDGLRLRDAASYDSNTLTVIPDGATAQVVGAEVTDGAGNVWENISYDGQTGYSSRDFLVIGGSATPAAQSAATVQTAAPSGITVGGNAQVTGTNGDGLNLRSDVGYDSAVQTVAPDGSVVHVIDGPKQDGSGNSWWGVDYSGMSGWMMADYLTETDQQPAQVDANTQSADSAPTVQTASAPATSSVGQQIAAEAMKYLGYPYVWAGTTPAGFDCSGFIYYVVNQVTGGGFPRDMASQVTMGSYVDANDLQVGDLVFQQNTYQWGLSHAGIYIGNGQFISAANESVGVTISNLWDSYWGSRYYTARRVGG